MVCPKYQADLAAINNTSNNYADFNSTLSQAFVDLKQNYTAKVAAVTLAFSSGASSKAKIAIKTNAHNTNADIEEDFKGGQTILYDFIQNTQPAELRVVQQTIGTVCDKVEFQMRKHLALMEYHCSDATDRNIWIHVDEFGLKFDANSLYEKTRAVVTSHIGKSADEMYAVGVAAIYENVKLLITEYKEKLKKLTNAYANGAGFAAVADTADDVIKSDWKLVQENLKKVMDFELPQLNTLKADNFGVDVTGNRLAMLVAYSVDSFYTNIFYDMYELSGDLFVAITILEFDLTKSAPATMTA